MEPYRAVRRFIIRLAIAMLIGAAASASRADNIQLDPVIALPNGIVLPVPAMPPTNADPMNPLSTTDVLTQRNNNLRTGTTLQPGFDQNAVRSHFGLIGILGAHDMEKGPGEGPDQDPNAIIGVVSAQPLFMEKVSVKGRKEPHPLMRSAVFIATSANWVYAFDADSLQQLWGTFLGTPYAVDRPFEPPPVNGKSWACNMAGTQNHDFGPGSKTELGIEATPVINLAGTTPRMIVSYRLMDGTPGVPPATKPGEDGMEPSGRHYIAALSLETGEVLINRRIEDDALFNQVHRNRAGLLLDGDRVYVAFAGRCENFGPGQFFYDKSYQGWIYAFDANTLTPAGKFRATQQPDGGPPLPPTDDPIAGGGIWQATTGLAADGRGNLYFATGNQTKCTATGDQSHVMCTPPDAAGKNLSNSIVRLNADSMTPTDWFTPYRKTWLDAIDLDFASAGVVLIPNTKYLVAGGKDGMMYVLDRDHLGKFDGSKPFEAKILTVLQPDPNSHTSGDEVGLDNLGRDQVVQKFQAAQNQYCAQGPNPLYCLEDKPNNNYPTPPPPPGPGVTTGAWGEWPHIHGTPVFGAFLDGSAFLYLWAEKDFLKSFRWWGRRFDTTAATINIKNVNMLPLQGKVATSQSGKPVLAPPYLPASMTPPGSGASGMPGGMLSLSIDPTQPHGGVLFASVQRCRPNRNTPFDLEKADPVLHECDAEECKTSTAAFSQCAQERFGMLRAFDPITLEELWNNQTDRFANDPNDPRFKDFNPPPKTYWYVKFVPPTIAHNRVFLPTATRRVLVYGLQ